MSDSEKTDKTGDKLVASIRKTRAGAAKKTTARKAATSGTVASTAGKQPKTRSRPAAGKAEKKVLPAPVSTDAYQYGRRIWPD